ncbi:MAG: hypothetical protein QM487_00135 [Candidatus Marithrix sp.]
MIESLSIQRTLIRQRRSFLLLLSVILGLFWLPSVQADTDCTTVTEIPQVECEALIALYDSTDGPNWDDSSFNNWNVTNTPCSWSGVICNGDGRVIWIDRFLMELSGTIPKELGNLTQLGQLRLSNNQLSGPIPSELGNLILLTDLYLSGNQLTGSIPSELGNLLQLRNLGLSNNQLTGTIPSELGNLTQLTGLYLSNNQLTGSIPSELGNLTQLTVLYLYNNQLTGSIPSELGNLTQLVWMKLSNNQLTGEIPSSLSNLTNLFKSSGTINLNTISGLDIGNNQLIASDAGIIDFLNNNDPDWFETQNDGTVPTEDVVLVDEGTAGNDGTTVPNDEGIADNDAITAPVDEGIAGNDSTSSDIASRVGFSNCSGNIIFGLCNNYGVLEDVIFEISANVAGGQLAGTIINKGLLSNFTNQPNGSLSGGKLTGYIENEGTLADFEFVGAFINGGILSGTIYNNSEVGGFFKDVQLTANTHIIGGTVTGNIQGDCEAPAKLENVTIKPISNLSCVIVDNNNDENMILGRGITIGEGVQFADLTSQITDENIPDGTGETPTTDGSITDGTTNEETPITDGSITDGIGETPTTDGSITDGTTNEETPITDGSTPDGITNGESSINEIIDEETKYPSLNGAINVNNLGKTVSSNASFASGISVNDRSFERSIESVLSDNINISGRIEVETGHIGQTIDITVVIAQVSSNNALHYFMLDTNGDFIPWDEDMGSLLSLQTVEASITPIEVQIYNGQLNNIGTLNFYIGYRLADGTVVYSPNTLQITITENNL